ncbi:UDP-glucose 4-epimerase [Helicostylum pulchrum]|uniref:NAD(P)-binding domain-containing protein n=1 Tax=Helicostylum pulchrum TaxID=562976 RepID=A0ABP9XSX8_9FUNG|nr:UDP-glucose 4-epimerase [Helicostylum pulchrum]
MPRICKSGTSDLVVDQLKVLEVNSKQRGPRFKPSRRQSLHRRRHTIDAWNHLDEPLIPCRRLSSDCSNLKKSAQPPHKRILVTGGAGYIGSHTCLELLNNGYDIVVMDNMVNSNKEALYRVEQLAGRPIVFIKGDVTHESDLEDIFQHYQFWAVIHFAAIKAVGESTRIPLEYYHNNLTGTLNLLRVMKRHNIKNLVFSSSATVYGEPEMMPVNETARLGPVTNPYGKTKLFAEEILRDLYASDPEWNVVLLRYFNPVGAHVSGMIGEHPHGVPNNLLPYVVKVLQGHLPFVHVYGNDYDTVDGTGVRDYIHVCDLATGHVAALKKLEEKPGCKAYNLGTGAGYSVLEIIHAMERATHKKIPYKIEDRRPGDVGTCTADASLANRELGWTPSYSMDDMCQDMWRWTQRNPNGYDGELLV